MTTEVRVKRCDFCRKAEASQIYQRWLVCAGCVPQTAPDDCVCQWPAWRGPAHCDTCGKHHVRPWLHENLVPSMLCAGCGRRIGRFNYQAEEVREDGEFLRIDVYHEARSLSGPHCFSAHVVATVMPKPESDDAFSKRFAAAAAAIDGGWDLFERVKANREGEIADGETSRMRSR